MADSNLETSGVKIVAEGADKFRVDIEKSFKALNDFNAANEKVAKANGYASASIEDAFKSLAKYNAGLGSAVTALGGLGGAAAGAGAGVSAGMAIATAAISTVALAASAAVAAISLIGSAVNAAVAYGSKISSISDATGLSGGLAQRLNAGAAISGNSVSGVLGTFNSIGKAADTLGEKSDKAFAKMGAAADKADTRLSRLNEDYARSIADINANAAERSQEINDRLVESHAAMLDAQARRDEDYAREAGDVRASLAQRIADIDASTSESLARINERQTRLTDDYARETESARDDLARSILDIETDLADSIEALQYRAAQQNTDAINDGAKAQEQIQENLQKELYSIEQKYNAKRQGLQDKIYDPNTNPILRAYYKTQLKSLDGLQKAETDGARSTAQAKAEQARRETEVRLSEIERGLTRETALEQRQADRRRAREQEDAARRQAERLREYNQQSGDLAAQIARENAQRDQQIARARLDATQRETDLKRSYERQNADAKASYDKQVADAAAAQLKIQAETEKRLANEKRQYDRALEDINAALAAALSSGGGGGSVGAGIDKVAEGFKKLNIDVEKFKLLSPDEQFKLLNDQVLAFVDSGNTDKAIEAIQLITGASREQAAQFVRSAVASREADKILKDLGFTDEQIEQARKTQEGFNTVKLALELLGAQIGSIFIPIVLDLIKAIKLGYEWFVDRFLPAIRDTYNFIKGKLEIAFATLGAGAVALWDKLEPVRKVVDAIANVAMVALQKAGETIASFWNVVLRPAIEKVGVALDQTLGNAVRFLINGALKDLENKFEGVRLVLQWLYDKLPSIGTFFNNLATSIGNIRVPDFSGIPSGLSSAAAGSFYGAPPSSPFRSQSIPATPAQLSAGRSSVSNTSNTSSVANVTVNVAKGDSKSVSDGVVNGLYRAGFKVGG